MPWLLALLLLALTTTPAASTPLDPRLSSLLDVQPAAEDIPFILTLTEQADARVWVQERGPRRRQAMIKELRQHAEGSQREIKAFLRQQGVRQLRSLWLLNAVAGRADAATLQRLAEWPQIAQLQLDEGPTIPEVITEPLAVSPWNLHSVQAPALWALGYTGKGVVVATMDTGADLDHPDLAGQWRGGTNSWFDPYGEHATPFDASGHGTQVLGILTGGSRSGTPIGVAPEARWISVKMFNDAGTSRTSAIIEGFQWLLDPDGNPETDDAPALINCSWGFADLSGRCDPLFRQALQTVRTAGIAVTVSAGNSGPGEGTSQSPANYLESLSVGALTQLDELASFSSRGPSACNGGIFPRLSAPGVHIRTTNPTSAGSYAMVSGTSFAAPHVAGILALLLEAFPGLSPALLEQTLEETARDLGPEGPDHGFGFGLVDGLAAYGDLMQWPHLHVGEAESALQSLRFNHQLPGETFEQRLLLTNSGGGLLSITSVTAGPSPFVLAADGCSGQSLSGGEQCAVTVRFSPLSSGAFAGLLHITSDATGSPIVGIPLRGAASLPPAPAVLLAPDDQAAQLGSHVTFRWRTAQGSEGRITNERLLLDQSLDFQYQLQIHDGPAIVHLARAGLLLLLLPFTVVRRWPMRLVALLAFVLLLACGNDGAEADRRLTVTGLEPATTYYWKIVSEDHFGASVESPVWQFTTAAAPLDPQEK
jgi:hypothetical protein